MPPRRRTVRHRCCVRLPRRERVDAVYQPELRPRFHHNTPQPRLRRSWQSWRPRWRKRRWKCWWDLKRRAPQHCSLPATLLNCLAAARGRAARAWVWCLQPSLTSFLSLPTYISRVSSGLISALVEPNRLAHGAAFQFLKFTCCWHRVGSPPGQTGHAPSHGRLACAAPGHYDHLAGSTPQTRGEGDAPNDYDRLSRPQSDYDHLAGSTPPATGGAPYTYDRLGLRGGDGSSSGHYEAMNMRTATLTTCPVVGVESPSGR